MAKRTTEESELEDLRKKIHELRIDRLRRLQKLMQENPDEFCRLACEAILGDQGKGNPLVEMDDELKGVRKHYQGLAETIMFKLDGAQINDESGHISINNWIKENAYVPSRPWPSDFDETLEARDILWRFAEKQEYEFSLSINQAYELIYHGTPIYVLDQTTGKFEIAPEDNPDYIFMSKLGEHSPDIRAGQLPTWTENYYFKRSDLEAHEIFYRGDPPEPSEIEVLRYAFRRHISPTLVASAREAKGRMLGGISSPSFSRLMKGIDAFPLEYPDYKNRPPKLDHDIRPWLQRMGYAKSDAEARVFGRIIADHFDVQADPQKVPHS